jgi:hypothetical protein
MVDVNLHIKQSSGGNTVAREGRQHLPWRFDVVQPEAGISNEKLWFYHSVDTVFFLMHPKGCVEKVLLECKSLLLRFF